MIKIGDLLLRDIRLGTSKITAAYIGNTKIYPNIDYVDSGIEYGNWVYADPVRTRTATPWTQDVYADGSRGPKIYGTQTTDKQTATTTQKYGDWSYTNPPTSRSRYVTPVYTYTDIVREGTPTTQSENSTKSTIYGDWVYNITTTAGSRTRTVTDRYQFTDTYKDITQANQTENGTRSIGAYTYNWAASTRTAIVTYTFTDATKTTPLTESGTVTYNPTFNVTGTPVSASGGTATFANTGTAQRLWNGSVISGQNGTFTISSLSKSATSPSDVSISELNVIFPTRGTVTGPVKNAFIIPTYSIDGKSITVTEGNSVQVSQVENLITNTTYTIDTLSANPTSVSSNGGTSIITTSGKMNKTFTSGAKEETPFTPNLSINSVQGVTLNGNIITFTSNASSSTSRSVIVTASYTGATSKTITVSQPAGIVNFTASVSFMFNQIDEEGNGNWYMNINTDPEINYEVSLKPTGGVTFSNTETGDVEPINFDNLDLSTNPNDETYRHRIDINPSPRFNYNPTSGDLQIVSKNSKYVCTDTTVYYQ